MVRLSPGSATNTSSSDGAIVDGVSLSIKASVLDYANSNPIAVRLTDTNGDYVTAGASTQYTEGDTDATITGSAILWEDTGNTLSTVSASKPLPVEVTDASIAVTGTFWQATQPVSLVSVPSHDVTNAGTFAVQVTSAPSTTITATDLDIRDLTSTDVVTVTGGVGQTSDVKITLDSEAVDTELTTADLDTGGGTDTRAVVGLVGSASGGGQLIPGSSTDGLLVNLGTNNDVTVTGSVTANAGTNLNTSLLALESGGNLASILSSVQTIDNFISGSKGLVTEDNSGSIKTAVELIDDVVYTDDTSTHSTGSSKGALLMAAATPTDGSVNANDIGAVAMTTDRKLHVSVQDAIPAGTNNIGDVDVLSIAAGNNNIGDVDVASIAAGDNNIGNVDVVTLPSIPAGTNAIGKLLPDDIDVTTHTNYARKYYTSTGAVTDGIVWSPAAGKRWHVTTLYLNVSAAATVTIEDDKAGGDDPVWKGELAANSGVVIPFEENYPMASGEDAADLLITTSAGNVYVTVVGYEI